jgi:hypothetical protein
VGDLPYRPHQRDQLDGSPYAGNNCNCASTATAIERASLGQVMVTSALVRSETRNPDGTKDVKGGTNLSQMRAVAALHGIALEVHFGETGSYAKMVAGIQQGRGVLYSGSSIVTRGTIYQESETYADNHAWYLNEMRRVSELGTRQNQFLVYMPLGDGRRPGIANSPNWIPESIVRRFAAMLDLRSEYERQAGYPPQRLGDGRAYFAFTRDTEAPVNLLYGAVSLLPYHVFRVNVVPPLQANVRRSPGGSVRARLPDGANFVAHQKATLAGALWFGNKDGNRWVHSGNFE